MDKSVMINDSIIPVFFPAFYPNFHNPPRTFLTNRVMASRPFAQLPELKSTILQDGIFCSEEMKDAVLRHDSRLREYVREVHDIDQGIRPLLVVSFHSSYHLHIRN